MKYFIIVITISVFSLQLNAQDVTIYKNKLDQSLVNTGLLYERIKLPDENLLKFKSENTLNIAKPTQWLSLYHNIYQAKYNGGLKHFLELKKQAKADSKQKLIDIAFLNYKFNKIASSAKKNAKAVFSGDNIIVKDKKYIENKQVFAVSPLFVKKNTGLDIIFNFSDEYYFTNYTSTVKNIIIDFDDGNGKQRIQLNRQKEIRYDSPGLKKVSVEIYLQDNSHFASSFSFYARQIAMPTPDETWNNYTADISYDGVAAEGEVAVFFGAGNTDFTRPVIISDGFDPGDIRDLSEIYDIVNQENLITNFTSRGYDLVLLNFNGGDDYIQRNAYLMTKLIQDINARMQAAGTMKPANQIAVVGPSMSGLVTRYAIDYMEQNGIAHNVRNWIAFDSPMNGANVPLGIQHWLRFFAEEADVSGAQEALETLQGPAAKQMLTYYYTATSGHSAGNHSMYTDFYNEINSMGYPQQTRIVAIANGSGYANGQPYAPGDQTIEYNYRSILVDLDGDIWALPNLSDQRIFYGVYDEWGFWAYEEENIYVNNSYPFDSAPGGTRATFQELDDTDTGGYGDIIAYYPDHAFIPTISSLAIQNSTDPYYDVNANINTLSTPFDKLYYPNTNQNHIEITPESFLWFEHEIINFPPVFTSAPATEIDEASLYTYTFSATDENEWNTIDFEVVSMPSWLSYDAATQTLTGTPDYDDIGTHSVIIKASDGLDDTLQSFDIEVFRKCTHAPETRWNGSTWSAGTPDASNFVTIDANYNSLTNGAINACSLKVENGKQLIVDQANPVNIERDVENNGEIFVKNKAAFVQSSDKAIISGTGTFKVEKIVDNLTHYYDMVFWSSPLNSNTFQLNDLLPNAWRYYSYNPATQYWVFEDGTANMQTGLGYTISAPVGHTSGDINIMFQKNSDPFNTGIIDVPISINGAGASDDDDWNLLGNPFPSAIDFDQFVADNPNVQGSYSLWTNCAGLNGNNHQPAGFTTYSQSGSVSACNSGGFTATRYISSAQGFYIEANAGGTVQFKNSQRVTHSNDNFASRAVSRTRMWLELTDDLQGYSQILLDFNANATTGIDRLYDAGAMLSDGTQLYSLAQQTALSIQALPSLSDDEQRIRLGYSANSNAQILHIHLSNFEGDLANKYIYLIDSSADIIHDLKQSDYSFTKNNADLDNRFQLLISERALPTNQEEGNNILVYQNKQKLIVESLTNRAFSKVILYDIQGKIIYQTNHISTVKIEIPIHLSSMILFCRIDFEDDFIIKKIRIE
jgi:hypothetical protein